MAFQLVASPPGLRVKGHSDAPAVGDFDGVVVAIGMRDTDPVAAVTPEAEDAAAHEPEGLSGWGTTYFLVSDEGKDAPVWVSKTEVSEHRLDPPG